MAKVWIAELDRMAYMTGGERIQAVMMPPINEMAFEFGVATLTPTAFLPATRGIRIRADADYHIKCGDNTVVATVDNMPGTSKAAEYFGVVPGQWLSIVQAD